MFGSLVRKKEEAAQALSEDLKRKISDLHLLVKGGTLSPDHLDLVQKELTRLSAQLDQQTRRLKGPEAAGAKPA